MVVMHNNKMCCWVKTRMLVLSSLSVFWCISHKYVGVMSFRIPSPLRRTRTMIFQMSSSVPPPPGGGGGGGGRYQRDWDNDDFLSSLTSAGGGDARQQSGGSGGKDILPMGNYHSNAYATDNGYDADDSNNNNDNSRRSLMENPPDNVGGASSSRFQNMMNTAAQRRQLQRPAPDVVRPQQQQQEEEYAMHPRQQSQQPPSQASNNNGGYQYPSQSQPTYIPPPPPPPPGCYFNQQTQQWIFDPSLLPPPPPPSTSAAITQQQQQQQQPRKRNDVIANTSDLYLEQLKIDTKSRIKARLIDNNDDKSNQVWYDERIYQLQHELEPALSHYNAPQQQQQDDDGEIFFDSSNEKLKKKQQQEEDAVEMEKKKKTTTGIKYREKMMQFLNRNNNKLHQEQQQQEQEQQQQLLQHDQQQLQQNGIKEEEEVLAKSINDDIVSSPSSPQMSSVSSIRTTTTAPTTTLTTSQEQDTITTTTDNNNNKQTFRTLMGLIMKHRGGIGLGSNTSGLKNNNLDKQCFYSTLQQVVTILQLEVCGEEEEQEQEKIDGKLKENGIENEEKSHQKMAEYTTSNHENRARLNESLTRVTEAIKYFKAMSLSISFNKDMNKKKEKDEEEEVLLNSLSEALHHAANICDDTIGISQHQQQVQPPPAHVEARPAPGVMREMSDASLLNMNKDDTYQLYQTYQALSAAAGDAKYGLKSTITKVEAEHLSNMLLDMRRVLLNELDRCPNTAKELSELSETSAKQAVASSSVAFSDRTECSKAQVANSEMGSPTSSSKVSSPSKLSSYGAIVSKYQQMLAKAKAEKAAAKST